jgi:hypothetical protein
MGCGAGATLVVGKIGQESRMVYHGMQKLFYLMALLCSRGHGQDPTKENKGKQAGLSRATLEISSEFYSNFPLFHF